MGNIDINNQSIVWQPTEEMLANSTLTRFMRAVGIEQTGVDGYEILQQRSEQQPEWFWQQVIDFFDLQFDRPYSKLIDTSRGIQWTQWCKGGTTNIVLNCLDKYRDTPTWHKPALLWESEDGKKLEWTYQQLDAEVCRLASGLKSLGLQPGDVIALYMPMVPRAAVALLAAAKIGAIIQPLFSGFGADSIVSRLSDSEAKAAIVVDGTLRRGKTVNLKEVMDEAARSLPGLQHIIVAENAGLDTDLKEGRDHLWNALCDAAPEDSATVMVDADDPCMIIHTSGTSGKPKGTIYSHSGFSMKVACDFGLMGDYQPTDRLMWMSDFGWLVGPVLVFSSLILGGTMVMAEGAIDYPDKGRFWRLIDDHQVSILGIAPTIIRAFIFADGGDIEKYDLSSIRLSISTGEPWTLNAWQWMFENVCKTRAPIINMSGGTEIGGTITSCTVIHPMKPCAFTGSTLGMAADVVDEFGRSVGRGEEGELVLRQPSPGLTRGLWRDPERYLDSYWSKYQDLWCQSDRVAIDTDGYWYILGRSDDVLKIAGKRTSPTEIEALALGTGHIVEAAAIGVPDEVKGEVILVVAKLAHGISDLTVAKTDISSAIVNGLGTPFKPKDVVFVEDLPKTRSMKIMRRLVRSACLEQPTGDLSALVNPESVANIRQAIREIWPQGITTG